MDGGMFRELGKQLLILAVAIFLSGAALGRGCTYLFNSYDVTITKKP